MRRILMLVLLMFSVQACAVNDESTAAQSSADIVEVAMLKFEFVPPVLEIKAGQTVRWVNQEKRQYHSVWFEKYGEAESDYIFPEETLDKTFDKPGEYDYRCGPHPKMIGKIIVK